MNQLFEKLLNIILFTLKYLKKIFLNFLKCLEACMMDFLSKFHLLRHPIYLYLNVRVGN